MSDHDEHDTDEKFDGWLREAAQDYNRPPARVPRDEMWAAIQGSRVTQPVPVAHAARMPMRRWQMAAAAVLLLGTGVVLGRGMRGSTGAPTTPAPVVASGDTVAGEHPAAAVHEPAAPSARVAVDAPAPRGGASGDAYTVATINHLARAEALLTSFKREGDASADASVERWARDLLGDTRLLLDSPAASDPRQRHLLEDLELVLAQIVQLRAESAADRNSVRRSIERGEVLTRIRSTIPAGSASGV